MKKQKTGICKCSYNLLQGEAALFDPLTSVYDEWFEKDGGLMFATELQAFQAILASLPKPWVEIGVGSGRFARSLGIDIGLDPSIKLLNIARKRGLTTFLGKGQPKNSFPPYAGFVVISAGKNID